MTVHGTTRQELSTYGNQAMFELLPPKDDGLYIQKVGEGSHKKHWFLMRYIDAFTTSMKNKKWTGLHYIDLFAGAGIEKLRTSQKLNWGSPMIAAKAPYPFDRLHLCEKNKRKYKNCRSNFYKHAQVHKKRQKHNKPRAQYSHIWGFSPFVYFSENIR